MNKIFKYPIEATDSQGIEMPAGAKILCVQTQGEQPCIWAQVDPHERMVRRQIWVYGTGHHMLRTQDKYVGTFQLSGGSLVFHVFVEN